MLLLLFNFFRRVRFRHVPLSSSSSSSAAVETSLVTIIIVIIFNFFLLFIDNTPPSRGLISRTIGRPDMTDSRRRRTVSHAALRFRRRRRHRDGHAARLLLLFTHELHGILRVSPAVNQYRISCFFTRVFFILRVFSRCPIRIRYCNNILPAELVARRRHNRPPPSYDKSTEGFIGLSVHRALSSCSFFFFVLTYRSVSDVGDHYRCNTSVVDGTSE